MISRKQRLAAEKGLAFLEAKHPGCVGRFNLDTLDMGDVRYCALAQASGTIYRHARASHELSEQEEISYGFSSDAPTLTGMDLQYRRLTVAYKELILERRAA